MSGLEELAVSCARAIVYALRDPCPDCGRVEGPHRIRPLSAKTIARIRAGVVRYFPPAERARAEATLAHMELLRARFETCPCGAPSKVVRIVRWRPGVLNTTPYPDRELRLCDACNARGPEWWHELERKQRSEERAEIPMPPLPAEFRQQEPPPTDGGIPCPSSS